MVYFKEIWSLNFCKMNKLLKSFNYIYCFGLRDKYIYWFGLTLAWHVAPKRVDRSGRGWHRSVHRSRGTMMVPIAGRSAPRATCHVAPDKPLHEIFCQGCRSNGGRLCSVCRSSGPHREPRSFVVSVPEGCKAHVPGAENVFDKGSSGSGKR